ncbi:myeloid differentiation primary response 88, partial [Paramuricea clavata]
SDSENFQFDVIDEQYPVQGERHSPFTLDDDGQLSADIPRNNRSPKSILSRQGSTDHSRFEQILRGTKNYDKISDIPYHVREEVKDSLNTIKESRNDWRGVASRMGVESLTIEKIKKDFKEDPTHKVFEELSNHKITKLLQVLYEMECHDVLNIFYDNFCINISDTGAGVGINREKYQVSKSHSHEPTPDSGISSAVSCEFNTSPFNTQKDPGMPENVESTTASQSPHSRPKAGFGAKQNTDEDFVSDEIFDGFICYAKEDRRFAYEILARLEAPPYCRKICIDFRDCVPGDCRLDQTVKIIEHRCKHMVVILSPNFTSSSNTGFQVRIALNLSPGKSDVQH